MADLFTTELINPNEFQINLKRIIQLTFVFALF